MPPLKYSAKSWPYKSCQIYTLYFFTQCYYFSKSKIFTLVKNSLLKISLSLKIHMPSKLAEWLSFTWVKVWGTCKYSYALNAQLNLPGQKAGLTSFPYCCSKYFYLQWKLKRGSEGACPDRARESGWNPEWLSQRAQDPDFKSWRWAMVWSKLEALERHANRAGRALLEGHANRAGRALQWLLQSPLLLSPRSSCLLCPHSPCSVIIPSAGYPAEDKSGQLYISFWEADGMDRVRKFCRLMQLQEDVVTFLVVASVILNVDKESVHCCHLTIWSMFF